MSDLPKGWGTATLNDLLGTDGLFQMETGLRVRTKIPMVRTDCCSLLILATVCLSISPLAT